MAQELKIRVGLDSTRLFAGLRGVQGALASSVGSIARIASRAGAALAAIGAPLTAGAFAVGIKGALDLGGALSDMAARTGIAAGELIVLQQAFKDSGLSAEQVGSAINRMQRSLFDASKGLTEPIRGLDAMGLEIDELMGLSPSEQFQKISQAISKIEDPTIRAAAAMQIFGRSGAELGALFSNPEAFEQAQRRLGSQAAILGKSADRFDAVSDTFNAIGVKIRGFFVGVADKILPSLEKIAAVLDSIDLAPIGEKFGASLQKAANILTNAFRTPVERVAEIERQIAGLQGKQVTLETKSDLSGLVELNRQIAELKDRRVKLETEGDLTGIEEIDTRLSELESRKVVVTAEVNAEAVADLDRQIAALEGKRILVKAEGDTAGVQKLSNQIAALKDKRVKIETEGDAAKLDEITAKLADLESRKIALGIDVNVDAVVGIERKILELERKRIELKAVGDTEGLKNIDAEINRLREQKIVLNADSSRFDTIFELIAVSIKFALIKGLEAATGAVLGFFVGIGRVFKEIFTDSSYIKAWANVVLDQLKLIGGGLLKAFGEAVTFLRAGLVFAVNQLQANLIPVMKFAGATLIRSLFPIASLLPKAVRLAMDKDARASLLDTAKAFGLNIAKFVGMETAQIAEAIEQVKSGNTDFESIFKSLREEGNVATNVGNKLIDDAIESLKQSIPEYADQLGNIVKIVLDAMKEFGGSVDFGSDAVKEKLRELSDKLNIPLEVVEAAAKKTAGAAEEAAEAVSETKVETTAGRAPDVDQFAKIGLFASGGAANAMTNFMQNIATAGRRTNELLSGTLTVKTTGPTFAVAES